uniref:Uncharacterized protein n=1 Tax=uncultured bacterium RM35 TaxID=672207 RepID=D3W8L9_9BACT|nr:conserved hypothetical protein [uncultured bacterium RM35]
MNGHIRPDRLADFARGTLAPKRAPAVEQHLAACDPCRVALDRIASAQAAMRAMREAPAPEVSSVRSEATIRWMRVSPQRAVRPGFFAAFGLAVSAAGLVLFLGRTPQPMGKAPVAYAPSLSPAAREPAPLSAMVTLVGGQVSLSRAGQKSAVEVGVSLGAADRLETQAASRVAAQWAPGSGLLLFDEASLSLERFDVGKQALRLSRGQVNVKVQPLVPTAGAVALTVTTPGHLVSVRGTWFTVAAYNTRTTVEVLEGVVEVSELDGSASTLLHAPARAVFGPGRATSAPLSAREATILRAKSEMNLIAPNVATGRLLVGSHPEGLLAVDGVELGSTPLRMLRPLGRHYVELSRKGFQPLKNWVTIGPGAPGELKLAMVRSSVIPSLDGPVPIEEMVARRQRQIRACYERSLKRDPTLSGTVSLQLRVGPEGRVTQAHVESASTLADPQVSECLQHEATSWRFATGKNATVVYPFVFRPR